MLSDLVDVKRRGSHRQDRRGSRRRSAPSRPATRHGPGKTIPPMTSITASNHSTNSISVLLATDHVPADHARTREASRRNRAQRSSSPVSCPSPCPRSSTLPAASSIFLAPAFVVGQIASRLLDPALDLVRITTHRLSSSELGNLTSTRSPARPDRRPIRRGQPMSDANAQSAARSPTAAIAKLRATGARRRSPRHGRWEGAPQPARCRRASAPPSASSSSGSRLSPSGSCHSQATARPGATISARPRPTPPCGGHNPHRRLDKLGVFGLPYEVYGTDLPLPGRERTAHREGDSPRRAGSAWEIEADCGAGGGCGGCVAAIEQLLDEQASRAAVAAGHMLGAHAG